MEGTLDVPAMLPSGSGQDIAMATLATLPLAKVCMLVYLFVIVLFLATTLDAVSFTLSSTISKGLGPNDEPNKGLKFVWCIILCLIPIGLSYAGTDIPTIKSIVLLTGMPLIVILIIVYKGFLKEMFGKFGRMKKEEIIAWGAIPEEDTDSNITPPIEK